MGVECGRLGGQRLLGFKVARISSHGTLQSILITMLGRVERRYFSTS